MKDPESGVVTVKIYDRTYALRTSGDPEGLRRLCADLDRRMRKAADCSGAADSMKVAILAALTLADELERARDTLEKMDESLSRRALACVSMLERFL